MRLHVNCMLCIRTCRFVLAHKMEIKILLSSPYPHSECKGVSICHSFSSKCVFMHTDSVHTHTLHGTPNTVQDACRMCALALYSSVCVCWWVGVHTDELIEGCANCLAALFYCQKYNVLSCIFKVFINLSHA